MMISRTASSSGFYIDSDIVISTRRNGIVISTRRNGIVISTEHSEWRDLIQISPCGLRLSRNDKTGIFSCVFRLTVIFV